MKEESELIFAAVKGRKKEGKKMERKKKRELELKLKEGEEEEK